VPDEVYTHGHDDAVLRSHRWRTAENSAAYLLPHLRPGASLLDVGCGPGTLTADLAARVAPGRVVGVDVAADVVAAAADHVRAVGAANVELVAGDFRTLDLGPGGFDVVHAHQVLQHLRDPVGALAAMAALVRPGGVVAARDGDYGAMTWAPADERLDRWSAVYHAVTRANGGEADAGRHLLAWAQEAGLADVAYTTSTWTFATPGDRAWWADLWAERTTATTLADHAVDYGVASRAELAEIAAGWRAWAAAPGGVFVVVHGEVLARPGGSAL
jgi:2-polyprenyl-3-methyl-5-hydroxy-6-metoxy-1,4-benzoquinol methylase